MEHIQGGQWWTRYQPVSYKLESRSGNRDQFINMVQRCRNAGLMVVADMVINHMTGHGQSGQGTGKGVTFSHSAKIDLNKQWLLEQKTIQNFNIDALGFRKTRNENPPTQEIGVSS